MTRKTLCILMLPILGIITLLVIGCDSNLLNLKRDIDTITIRDRKVCVLIPENIESQVSKVIIDGNEVSPEQFVELKTGKWAEVSYYKTPHIKAWMENNSESARKAYEKVTNDYNQWQYDTMKSDRFLDPTRFLDPKVQKKNQEWEQKVAVAKRELDKWDTMFNEGLPTNWIDELGKYVTIQKNVVEQ